ncbi:hypothetical protein L1049_004686 [Liquidambar formosana]|uniref:RNase H type-1 domain-containing protein n=1 Tax=Liquidambar formosana TaxID=63359 RepID=A0AAP0RTU2_LIQFO
MMKGEDLALVYNLGCSFFSVEKLNFDGSRKHNKKKASVGFVIRDECGASFNLGNALVLAVECTALRNGLIKGSQKGIRRLQIEGDFQLVINAIYGTIQHYWSIDNLIQDIWNLLSTFDQVAIRHVFSK